MCEMTGYTERGLFASAVHADAAVIAELNSLRRYAMRCEDAREITREIDSRVIARARRMGLAPDALGDALESATLMDDGRELQAMDEVRDAAGNHGTVAAKRAANYIVIFDTPTGTRSLVRTRPQLTLVYRPEVAKAGAA